MPIQICVISIRWCKECLKDSAKDHTCYWSMPHWGVDGRGTLSVRWKGRKLNLLSWLGSVAKLLDGATLFKRDSKRQIQKDLRRASFSKYSAPTRSTETEVKNIGQLCRRAQHSLLQIWLLFRCIDGS